MKTLDDLIDFMQDFHSNFDDYGHPSRIEYKKTQGIVLGWVIKKAQELKANMEADDGWVKFDSMKKKSHPKDAKDYLCIVRANDSKSIWYEVLKYDYPKFRWNRGDEYISNWHIVTHYYELPSPPKGEE